jgi:hypothetical protein
LSVFSSPCYVYAVSNSVLVVVVCVCVCVFIWCLGSEVKFDTWIMDNVVGSLQFSEVRLFNICRDRKMSMKWRLILRHL